MKKSTLTLIVIIITSLISTNHNAQENVTYQKPPKEILELVDVELALVHFSTRKTK